ncbi:SAP domain-containing protein [Liquorilactobacillus mali]|uniref:SAP domain-containing protein n=1 Tax=Liquorilactobacillus mali TaxID=1618 RepID=UPI00264B7182|nr:SAP domain-containing protein [Liquorilactobacillus mali]MDN7144405.1 SAP domain-containing protein [Liquorilactobacillus mali]
MVIIFNVREDILTTRYGDEISLAKLKIMWRLNLSNFTTKYRTPSYYRFEFKVDMWSELNKLIALKMVDYVQGKQTLKLLTMPQLKDILRLKRLKVGGKKADLIDRIKLNFTEKELETSNIPKEYFLTKKGAEIYLELEDWIWSYDILKEYYCYGPNFLSEEYIYELLNLKKSKYETEFNILNQLIAKHEKRLQFGTLGVLYYRLSDFQYKNGNLKDALKAILSAAMLEASGLKDAKWSIENEKGQTIIDTKIETYEDNQVPNGTIDSLNEIFAKNSYSDISKIISNVWHKYKYYFKQSKIDSLEVMQKTINNLVKN